MLPCLNTPRRRRAALLAVPVLAVTAATDPLVRLMAAAALALLLAGCGDAGRSAAPPTGVGPASSAPLSAPPTAASPASAVDASCGAPIAGGRTVRFGVGTATNLVGVLLGTGGTGLVFAHGSQGTRCQWASYAQESVKAGYRALIFDFAGHGESTASTDDIDEQVLAAVGYLRSQGVQRVVLVGASMGGTAVLAAAARISPPVAGVISLSGPAGSRGVNAGSAVTKLAVPVLYAAARAKPISPKMPQTFMPVRHRRCPAGCWWYLTAAPMARSSSIRAPGRRPSRSEPPCTSS